MKFELEYLTHEICSRKVNGKITEKIEYYMGINYIAPIKKITLTFCRVIGVGN